jgi:hypothetical protein
MQSLMAESSAATFLMSVHLLSPSVRFQLIRTNKTNRLTGSLCSIYWTESLSGASLESVW